MADDLDQLRALLTSRGELVGSLTHDLKGLITGLEGGLYLVDSGVKKNRQERVAQGLEMARRNLDRMRRAIGSALYYVKERDLVREPVELPALLQSVHADLADYAAGLGVELRLGATDGTAQSDDLALHALLIDIVDYAVVSGQVEDRDRTPSVTLEAVSVDDHFDISVSVTGFEIPAEVLQQLRDGTFAPRQGDRAHLGLFIANTLVEALGGELGITSDAAVGTRLTVRLQG